MDHEYIIDICNPYFDIRNSENILCCLSLSLQQLEFPFKKYTNIFNNLLNISKLFKSAKLLGEHFCPRDTMIRNSRLFPHFY